MATKPTAESQGPLSRATAARLSLYLRCVRQAEAGTAISSLQLSQTVGVSDAQVRRDLAAVGHLGQRGVGYDAAALREALRAALGIDRTWPAALVGVGHLARALLRYQGFRDQGFRITHLFDTDPRLIGTVVDGRVVQSLVELPTGLAVSGIELGVLTVPSDAAQGVADQLVAGGIRGILNFAPVLLRVPSTVRMVNVDMAIQFEQLAYLVGGQESSGERAEGLEPDALR
ncbi:MAG: redox-sensing transcriptional repressor Rex [Gemmataceae bacterium]